jgi:nucleoid DNA-binding protein
VCPAIALSVDFAKICDRARNPATGEKMTVAASKKLTFAPAKALKDALNK